MNEVQGWVNAKVMTLFALTGNIMAEIFHCSSLTKIWSAVIHLITQHKGRNAWSWICLSAGETKQTFSARFSTLQHEIKGAIFNSDSSKESSCYLLDIKLGIKTCMSSVGKNYLKCAFASHMSCWAWRSVPSQCKLIEMVQGQKRTINIYCTDM